jgi:hypothetical protein
LTVTYLKYLDKYEREAGENEPIGIILCAQSDRDQVELLEMDKAGIAVAEYLTVLPPKADNASPLSDINQVRTPKLAAMTRISRRTVARSRLERDCPQGLQFLFASGGHAPLRVRAGRPRHRFRSPFSISYMRCCACGRDAHTTDSVLNSQFSILNFLYAPLRVRAGRPRHRLCSQFSILNSQFLTPGGDVCHRE